MYGMTRPYEQINNQTLRDWVRKGDAHAAEELAAREERRQRNVAKKNSVGAKSTDAIFRRLPGSYESGKRR
jgi:hypothetical protein